MRRFFYDPQLASQPLAVGAYVALPPPIVEHWGKVLRASVGDEAMLFDGTGGEYRVRLTELNKKTAWVEVLAFDPIERALAYRVTLGLVMSRGERMDYAVQKSTEMGVTDIQLLTSQHGEVRLKPEQTGKKVEHWRQVAISACEQSGLNRVPTLHPPQALTDWLAAMQDNSTINLCPTRLILSVPDSARCQARHTTLATILASFDSDKQNPPTFVLLIGAEGGFSPTETTLAYEQGFLPWQLGERVLRTETAPVAALASLQAIFELASFAYPMKPL